jgi:hypothetical protein
MESAPKMPAYEARNESKIALENAKTPEEFLSAVNFEEINHIFDILISRIGHDVQHYSTGHRVVKEKISFVPNFTEDGKATFNGKCDVETGEIIIVWDTSAHNDLADKIYLLKVLIHESTHVRAGFYYGTEKYNQESFPRFMRSGINEIWQSSEDSTVEIGTSINEAITENISHEVLHEYLVREGYSGYMKQSDVRSELMMGSYTTDRVVLSLIIDALARIIETPRENVWVDIVSTYLSGSQDIKSFFDMIQNELESEKELDTIIPLMLSGKSLEDLNIDATLFHIAKKEDAEKAFDRVMFAFDKDYIENVLKLR